jgi:hypothetical protein
MGKRTYWNCSHFSIALPQDRLPTLLRRVAKHIEVLGPEFVQDIVVRVDHDQDMVASVYFTPSRKSSAKTVTNRPQRQFTRRRK